MAQPLLPLDTAESFRVGDAAVSLTRKGRRVTGEVRLAVPNVKRRTRCAVNYTVPRDWTAEEERLALRCAVTWFTEIGGLATITHRHLCHLVQAHRADPAALTGEWIIAGIKSYARREWNATNRTWMDLGRWLSQRMGTDIEESPEYRAAAERRQTVPQIDRAETVYDAWLSTPAHAWPGPLRTGLWTTLPIYRQRRILKLHKEYVESRLGRPMTRHEENYVRTGSDGAVQRVAAEPGLSAITGIRHYCVMSAVEFFMRARGRDPATGRPLADLAAEQQRHEQECLEAHRPVADAVRRARGL